MKRALLIGVALVSVGCSAPSPEAVCNHVIEIYDATYFVKQQTTETREQLLEGRANFYHICVGKLEIAKAQHPETYEAKAKCILAVTTFKAMDECLPAFEVPKLPGK